MGEGEGVTETREEGRRVEKETGNRREEGSGEGGGPEEMGEREVGDRGRGKQVLRPDL